jgi:beta-phosphoglucomutase
MATVKGFIFDLDGVIVDTAKYHYKAWRRLANELGIDFGEAENEQLKGVSRRESLEKILAWGNKSLPEAEMERMMARKNEWYLEYVREMKADDALPGALGFLKATRALNLHIALGSASKNAVLILDLLGFTEFFEAIIDGTKIDRSKPDPQVFQKGADALGIDPSALVVFEDSVAGVEAAQRGGFRSVGVGQAHILKEAEIVIKGLGDHSPAEIINKLNF